MIASPRSFVVPICQRIGYRRFRILGTAFYVTRYGLLATAEHVVRAAVSARTGRIDELFVLQERDAATILFRGVTSAAASDQVDVALVQLETRTKQGAVAPNPRVRLSMSTPSPKSPLCSYAYPQNHELAFQEGLPEPVIGCDYIEGEFIEELSAGERPNLSYPHYETTLAVPSGASGAPVFDSTGSVIGICSRGWDFGQGADSGPPLSSIIPSAYFSTITRTCASPPMRSPEYLSTPTALLGAGLSFKHLVELGHVEVFNARRAST